MQENGVGFDSDSKTEMSLEVRPGEQERDGTVRIPLQDLVGALNAGYRMLREAETKLSVVTPDATIRT